MEIVSINGIYRYDEFNSIDAASFASLLVDHSRLVW